MNNGEFKLEFVKTYATEENARAAVRKKGYQDLRHTIIPVPVYHGASVSHVRYAVLFVGMAAVDRMVHFDFNIVG